MAAAAMGDTRRPAHVRYLIIGAGAAGSNAAEAIRALDPSGDILLVGQEVNRPYHRPPLSKSFLRGEVGKGTLPDRPAEWFAEHSVGLVTGRRATRLDCDRRQVTFDDGRVVGYDELLLSFGGMVAPLEAPGAGLPGLFYLRSLADAEAILIRLKTALREGRPHPHGRGRVAVLGGGTLGVEVAASLKARGLWVELVCDRPDLWHYVAGAAAAHRLRDWMDHNGVILHMNNPAAGLLGDGRVQRVELAGGEKIQCDFAVACLGMRVDRRLVQGTPIAMGNRLICDSFGRVGSDAGIEHVWAAGDCCSLWDDRFEKHVPGGHWDFARQSGTLAGQNMARAATGQSPHPWRELPGWHSEVFGLDIYAWGVCRLIERRIVQDFTESDRPDVAEIGIDAEGRVCHVLALGRHDDLGHLRKLVEDRAPAAEIEGR